MVRAPALVIKIPLAEGQVVYRPSRKQDKNRQAGSRQHGRATDKVQEKQEPTVMRPSRDECRTPVSAKFSAPSRTLFLTNLSASNATVTPMCDLVSAVESGEFYLDDTTLIDSTRFFRVCLNDNHMTSR